MSENYTNMTLLTCWVAWHCTWRIFTRMYITKINFSRCYIARETLEMQPKKAWTGQPIGQRNICPRMCHDPVGHTNNSTITTCADGATQHRGDEGLGVNIFCSSSSALCHTRNNDGKSRNSLVVQLYQRDIQSGKPVSLERFDDEEQQENSRKQDKDEDGVRFPEWWWWHSIFRTRGWSSPQKRFPLEKKYSLQQQNCVQLIFLYLPCYETMGLLSPFVFYALVEIVIRFFDTDLSVLIRYSVIDV